MITEILQNKYICISNNSKAQIKGPTGFSKSYQKYGVPKLRQVTDRAVDLLSAFGPAGTIFLLIVKKGKQLKNKK